MPARHRAKDRIRTKGADRPRRRARGDRQSHDLKEALGASRGFPIVSKPHGPFGVMALLDELQDRLVSRGGRPADSAPTIRRLVPLRKHVWKELQAQADELSSRGRHVSPGQLAAILLERSVSDRENQRRRSSTPSDAESPRKL
jgi:hypothetical protein